jgi:glycosyl transferase, family 25
MQKIAVYVLSCESARERRALMKTHLDELNIEYEFVDAVEGAKLDPAYRESLTPNRNMAPGVLGCYLSHIQVYERLVATRTPVALILEDDTVLDPRAKALLENGCDDLDFDYCFLGSDDRGDEGFVFYDPGSATELARGLKAYLLSSGPFCLNAYLITLQGAKQRLGCAHPILTAIDHYHFLPYRPRFKAVIPMLAFLNEHHAMGANSSTAWTMTQKRFHGYWWFYPLRDLVKLKALRKMLVRNLGKLRHERRWRPFPSAMKVPPPNRRQKPAG